MADVLIAKTVGPGASVLLLFRYQVDRDKGDSISAPVLIATVLKLIEMRPSESFVDGG